MNRETIGDYTVVKQIGQGSLGAVFLAEHRFLKRPYALKVLPEELTSDRGFIQRFEKEVGEIASLEHPHIVKVHNVSYAEGQFFLVTDCIVDVVGETTNLAEYVNLKDDPLSEEELLAILHQVASAIDYAHSQGVAHRGIKLNNILIGRGEQGVHVHLSDFALSRVIGVGTVLTKTYKILAEALGIQEKGDLSKLSKVHLSFWQNYAFLAPEQKRVGELLLIDAKADIWAFGVLAYYLISKEFPEGMFAMPSHVAPHYKLDWDQLVVHCLQYDPEKRPTALKPVLEQLLHATAPANIPFKETPRPILKPQEILRPQFEADPGAIFQAELSIGRYHPVKAEERDVEPLESEMIMIPAGTYFRGSNDGGRDEMPRHPVHLAPFALDAYPVTNEQFILFLEVLGGEKDHNNNDIIRLRESRIKRSGGKLNIESGYARHPVVGVTWYGAVAYARWVGKRLPTEAEWETAARGGSEENTYPTGKNIERSQANFFSTDTTAVMSYPPNSFGLYDMAGNVYQWCQDWYDYHYYDTSAQEPNNPKGPLQGVYRILRGGCWKSLKEDLRCAHRARNNPGALNGTYGFRCAADVS